MDLFLFNTNFYSLNGQEKNRLNYNKLQIDFSKKIQDFGLPVPSRELGILGFERRPKVLRNK